MEMKQEIKPEPRVESITIVSGSRIDPVERARLKINDDDFAEVRVVKNSPKKMETVGIKRGTMPTEGFRNAIKEAGIQNITF